MNKKGAELSVNVIIVAAIALAVLVVLFMIFTGRMGIFSKGVSETTSCQQACKAAGYEQFTDIDETSTCGGAYPNSLPGFSIIKDGVRKKCCCA